MKKPSHLIIFLTVFIDLIGFGIVLPLLPIYSRDFGVNGFMIGAIVASYSLMQFLFAPWWGHLSDKIGRRPVLLISLGGSALSYMIFAIGSGLKNPDAALWVLLLSRVLAGICGANISVAQAYIADITPKEHRSKRMGLVGMAFGLGFIFGPALAGAGLHLFGRTGPGWIAAVLTAGNFLFALVRLPESWKPSSDHVASRPRVDQWLRALRLPKVGLLIGLFFLATFCFTCFEITLGLLVSDRFHLKTEDLVGQPTYDPKIIWLYAFCGVVGAMVQGGAIGRAVKLLGEPLLIAVSLTLVAVAMVVLPYAQSWPTLLAALVVLSIGSGLTRPPVFGMISILTPEDEQGAVIGVAQSAGSLARIVGPIFATSLFAKHQALPYLICGSLSLLAGFLAWQFLCRSQARSTERASAAV